jgi:hypothetical protein
VPATDFAYKLEMDLDRDGSFEQDESVFFYEASINRGRTSALEPMRPGQMTLLLNNLDGRYSPLNAILSGLDEYTPVRLSIQWTTPAVTNLVDNPSVETDLVGWTAPDSDWSIARVTTESRQGATAVEVTTTGIAGINGVNLKQRDGNRFPVTALLDYTSSYYVKGVDGNEITIAMRFFDAASGGSQVGSGAKTITLAADWARIELTVNAPTGATHVELRFTGANVGPFHIDGAQLEQASLAALYCDGDQPGCSWSGTAHESTSSRSANPEFLLFQGFILDFDLPEGAGEYSATLTCIDRMGLIAQAELSLGNMLNKGTALILHRLLDKLEKDEKITNPGLEWTKLQSFNPETNYSAVTGATIGAFLIASGGNEDLWFEGDWIDEVIPDGAQALSGERYDATSDVDALGDYVAVRYARATTGTVAVRFRFLRDSTVLATKTVTLTTSWQRIELDISLSGSLGTNRYFELVTDIASSTRFHADSLHCVLKKHRIVRDFDAGAETLSLVNAYHAAADAVLSDVVKSEPAIMFVKAKTLTEGDAIAFRDQNSRPSTAIPRIVFGDGDGLLQFLRLGLRFAAMNRYDRVEVRSRGTPNLETTPVVAWELSPYRALVLNEEFRAHYRQTIRRTELLFAGPPNMEGENVNFGSGHDMKVIGAGTPTQMFIQGTGYTYPTEESVVIKTDPASGLLIPNVLPVMMPLQDTNSAAMDAEAVRLRDRYKNRVLAISLSLKQWTDDVLAFQIDAELNDLVLVRAESQAFSPGIDKKFWIEGITHNIVVGEAIETVLLLEEL